MSVLIVEDTAVAAKLLELHIKALGYPTITASSGEAAVAALEGRPDIDLVITDTMMPGMDGFALIRAINERREWRSLPTVVATALSDIPNAKQIAQLGVHHYLLKPVDKAQLLRIVRAALSEREATLISKREVIERLDLDPAMYASLAASFADMVDESIRQLAEPREQGCIPPGLGLNGLYEAATMFGIDRLQSLARKLLDSQPSAPPSTTEIDLECLAHTLRTVTRSLQREAGDEGEGPASGLADAAAGEPAAG